MDVSYAFLLASILMLTVSANKFLAQIERWKMMQQKEKSQHVLRVLCEPPKLIELRKKLGSSLNERYMAINRPMLWPGTSIPMLNTHGDFEVSPNFKRTLMNDDTSLGKSISIAESGGISPTSRPAASLQQVIRSRRSASKNRYSCSSEEVWTDLGKDYFPRYLRSVKCKRGQRCFIFGRCQPKAFTVKLLKRRQNHCRKLIRTAYETRTLGSLKADLPKSLRNQRVVIPTKQVILVQEWSWEERAVTFCCSCRACQGGMCPT